MRVVRNQNHLTESVRSIRRLLAAIGFVVAAWSACGCGIADPDGIPASTRSGLDGEVIHGQDLGGYLDDVDEPVNESLFTVDSHFLDEVRRQGVVEGIQRSLVARDFSGVVTVEVIRFRNAGYGRALLNAKGTADPDPPKVPPGGRVTLGELKDDYAERAVVFAKGPTFVRLEVISTAQTGAVATSRTLLSRASLRQFSRLRSHESLPGDTFKAGRLKRYLARGTIAGAVLIALLASLATAIRDRTNWQRLRNALRGRPSPPPHAVDVGVAAAAVRRRLAWAARLRVLAGFAILITVELLPLGIVASGAVLASSVLVWELGATLLRRRASGRSPARRRAVSESLLAVTASTVSLIIVGFGLFIAWFGVVVETFGTSGLTQDDLSRFRTLTFVVAAVVLVLSRIPAELGRRLAMRRASRRVRDDARPEVLLLRSFVDDDLRIRVRRLPQSSLDRLALRRWERFEQSIAHSLFEFGPVEAVGEPGRFLPPLGATRTYYSDDAWQSEVARRIERAGLVVMSVGRTPSVAWELRNIRERDALARTIFVLAPVAADERRARLHVLAELLGVDVRLLDFEQPGLAVLAVVIPDGRTPALVTSAIRDDISYDAALGTAAKVLDHELRAGAPVASVRARGAPPTPLIVAPGDVSRPRRSYRRPRYVVTAIVVAAGLFSWGLTKQEEPVDRFDKIVELAGTTRFVLPVQDASTLISVQNAAHGVRVSEVEPENGRVVELGELATSPKDGAVRGDWIVLVDPVESTVTGLSRSSRRTWTVRAPGGPRGVTIVNGRALVALTEADAIVELRLRDGAVLRREAVPGGPIALASAPDGTLVSLAAKDRVTTLGSSLRPAGREYAIHSPREVFAAPGGLWALSATTGALVRLGSDAEADTRLSAREFLPQVAAAGAYVAVASRKSPLIAVADARTGEIVRLIRSPLAVQTIALSSAGYLAVAAQGYRDLGVYRVKAD